MFRFLYVFGTRPEVIRAAGTLRLLAADKDAQCDILNTGQHYDANMMSDFLRELGLPPVTYECTTGSLEPADQVAAITAKVGEVLTANKYDAMFVFGDTNSTVAAAIAASKLNQPIVHIEAGCRSFDMHMPEEINRRITDHISGLLLAVSNVCAENLKNENVLGRVEVVGDPQYEVFKSTAGQLGDVDKQPQGLVTVHRAENTDDVSRLHNILNGLEVAAQQAGITWIFPVHPRTRKVLQDVPASVKLTDPLSYSALLRELARSRICVTDSGGLQKEALWSQVPCVTVRPITEWVETVHQGANVLAPPTAEIAPLILTQLNNSSSMDFSNPYGDENASLRLIAITKKWVKSGESLIWTKPLDVK